MPKNGCTRGWAASHPTHLRIFVIFFKVAAGPSKLRLYHEVSVSDDTGPVFESINGHRATGTMRDATRASAVGPAAVAGSCPAHRHANA